MQVKVVQEEMFGDILPTLLHMQAWEVLLSEVVAHKTQNFCYQSLQSGADPTKPFRIRFDDI